MECLFARCRQTKQHKHWMLGAARCRTLWGPCRDRLRGLLSLLLYEFTNTDMFLCRLSVDSPNCAKTLGLTFSCQAAAAAATSAASRTQRSTSMAAHTSHKSTSLDTRGATQDRRVGRAAAGGRLAPGARRGARGAAGRACAAGAPRSRMRGAAECGPRTWRSPPPPAHPAGDRDPATS